MQVAGCAARVQAWLQEMAPHVKALAPRQLLTIGVAPSLRPVGVSVISCACT